VDELTWRETCPIPPLGNDLLMHYFRVILKSIGKMFNEFETRDKKFSLRDRPRQSMKDIPSKLH